jgi:Tfp pilus assembly protein PilV
MINRPRKPAGFILFELMFVLLLLTLFSLGAIQLVGLSLKVPKQAGERHNQVLRFDAMVTRLREDVWSARSIVAPDERTLKLESDDSPAITWKVEDGRVERAVADSNASQKWELDQQFRFVADRSTLLLNVKEKTGEPGTIRMSSQRMLLEGGRR